MLHYHTNQFISFQELLLLYPITIMRILSAVLCANGCHVVHVHIFFDLDPPRHCSASIHPHMQQHHQRQWHRRRPWTITTLCAVIATTTVILLLTLPSHSPQTMNHGGGSSGSGSGIIGVAAFPWPPQNWNWIIPEANSFTWIGNGTGRLHHTTPHRPLLLRALVSYAMYMYVFMM